jgi:glycerophosphoryl diester phosphodiesterase
MPQSFLFLAVPLLAGLLEAQPAKILTSAHRGEHFHNPENSLPAIRGAINAGMDFVEIDVRTTSDGQLVLMHDPSVNRMTNGTGLVAKMTFAEIRKLDLGARFPGRFPGLTVPSFEEALQLAKGRIGIYLHTKAAAPKDLVATIERYEMGDHVMFYSEDTEFLGQVAVLRPKWILMPEALTPENVRVLVERLHPRMFGFDSRDFNPPTIAAAKRVNIPIFVDRNTPREWQDAIDVGVAGIQTDHPFELMAFLRAKGYRE